MINQIIFSKISLLSEKLQEELLLFVDFLISKQLSEVSLKRKPVFNCAKGTFKMSEDFDEPLEDFKDYIP